MSEITVGSEWVSKANEKAILVVSDVGVSGLETYWLGVPERTMQWRTDDFLSKYKPRHDAPKAVQILNEAVAIMAERGKSYDKSGGEAERSMPKIVAMFNALTGHELTPEQGWKFMCCLKLARSEQGEYQEDNYLDGAAYMALAGEEAEAGSE